MSQNFYRHVALYVFTMCLTVNVGVAQSAVINEVESNDVVADANPGYNGTLTGIFGGLTNIHSDVDIWHFSLTAGQQFSVFIDDGPLDNLGGSNSYFPVMLLLMDDPATAPFPQPVALLPPLSTPASHNIFFTPWLTGDYFLAITDANKLPVSFLGFPISVGDLSTQGTTFTAFTDMYFNPISNRSWDYILTVNGATNAPLVVTVPEPGIVALLGLGLIALRWNRARS